MLKSPLCYYYISSALIICILCVLLLMFLPTPLQFSPLFWKSLLSFSPSDTLILIPLLKRWELCVDKIISMSDLWPRLFQRYSHRSCVWETSTTQMFVTPLTYPLRNTGSSLSGIPQAPGSSATASARVRSLGFQISTHEEQDHFSLASVNLKSLQKWGGEGTFWAAGMPS